MTNIKNLSELSITPYDETLKAVVVTKEGYTKQLPVTSLPTSDSSATPEGGENGATFTPTVSVDGDLSWTNNKELENPATVNIKGPAGEKGEQGVQGEIGPQGLKGDSGENGATFTPAVDEDGNISWVNDKELENPTTVNIKGPKGDAGIDGAQGLPGEAGPKGDKGADGKSAYQYAVDGGYKGTEEEFTAAIIKAAGAVTIEELNTAGYFKAVVVTEVPTEQDANTIYFVQPTVV